MLQPASDVNGTDLMVFGYLHETIESDDKFIFVIPVDIKLLCSEYCGYPSCCICLKRNIMHLSYEDKEQRQLFKPNIQKNNINKIISYHTSYELNDDEID
eukprot:301021_1